MIRDPQERPILRGALVGKLAESPQRDLVSAFLAERLADSGEAVEVRAAAASGLGTLGLSASRPVLERAAGADPAPAARLAARRALLTLGVPDDDRLTLLTAILTDTVQPGAARAQAAGELGELGDRRALAPLVGALRDPAPSAQAPSPNPLEQMMNTVIAARVNVPAAAARALGRLGDPSASPALLAQARSPDAELRIAVFEALVALRAGEAVPAARAALSDPAERVRRWAAVLLRELGTREALPELRAALGDSDAGVRMQAAHALGNLRDADALGPLETALQGERVPAVRTALEQALQAVR